MTAIKRRLKNFEKEKRGAWTRRLYHIHLMTEERNFYSHKRNLKTSLDDSASPDQRGTPTETKKQQKSSRKLLQRGSWWSLHLWAPARDGAENKQLDKKFCFIYLKVMNKCAKALLKTIKLT